MNVITNYGVTKITTGSMQELMSILNLPHYPILEHFTDEMQEYYVADTDDRVLHCGYDSVKDIKCLSYVYDDAHPCPINDMS